MTLSRPIPKALLPHSAILKTPVVSGIFTDGDYEEKTLHNVRVQLHERVRQSKSGETRSKGAAMYFDVTNSSPQDVKFKTEQLIIFCGITYKIESVRAVMAADRIHHYRIEMI